MTDVDWDILVELLDYIVSDPAPDRIKREAVIEEFQVREREGLLYEFIKLMADDRKGGVP